MAVRRAGVVRSSHASLTHLYDLIWTPQGLITVNEYVPSACPITDVVPTTPLAAARIVIQLCDGLTHIHCSASAHGDISPPNTIVDNLDNAYLIDYDYADPTLPVLRSRYKATRVTNRLEDVQLNDVEALREMCLEFLRLAASVHAADSRTIVNIIREIQRLPGEGTSLERLDKMRSVVSGSSL